MKTPKPALHEEFPMESRVEVINHKGSSMSGVICGISQDGVIFSYIVKLNSPVETEFGSVGYITVPGVCLRLI